ncbi:hypothetical protein H6G06_06725 [Anabaena sphaerica FACHB-251]|uniref:Uncharacterized protein n=1 Tax=Anabaena sphaerica FACHB-251 TaxID=2692883 RepID=A0A926WGS4_9NOST|nr:hypothetical protein [Anabaena sphaerica]MBD2293186.1 hypothetical protein [Anabaena sphaerica FACHB-251]
MNNITISNVDNHIKYLLQEQSKKHGCSLKEEAKKNLRLALTQNNAHS